MNPKTVEILQNIDFADQKIIGKSITILARFAQEKLPVSTGFVVTTLGFHQFLDFSDLRLYYENSRKTDSEDNSSLQDAFEVIEFPNLLASEISKAYAKISGFTDAFVNMRALVLDKDGQEISHRSFAMFDVRGEKNLILGLKNLYKDVVFDNENNIDKFFNGELQIVVLAQKAQQSEASGIMFTTDIISGDSNKLAIEAVYGLESIVDQEALVPDQYIYDKTKNEIVEKHIATQEYMAVRHVGGGSSMVQKVRISPAWQKRQKLDDKHILTLAKTGQIIEEGMQEPQQVIWSFEAGKIWINFIESSMKLSLGKKGRKATLQNMIDEEVFALEEAINTEPENELDTNLSAPEEEGVNKSLLVDFILSDNPTESPKESLIEEFDTVESFESDLEFEDQVDQNESLENNQKHMVNTEAADMQPINTQEPLLEGKYFKGDQVQGEICLDPAKCNKNSILVLKGDEDIPTSIEPAGFIIEDESYLLVERLFDFFNVPVITGVPLARKILKQGELIEMDASTGFIYETVPFSEQVGEIEMNFVTHDVNKEEKSILGPQVQNATQNDKAKDLNSLLNLVEEDSDIVTVQSDVEDDNQVEGVSDQDQFNIWGKSLEKIISASKNVPPTVAADALEHVIDDQMDLEQNSKEFSFDTEEAYIAKTIHADEVPEKEVTHFIPTATKVYVNLIDEKLPSGFENFDGIVFSSSLDQDMYFEILEDVLKKSQDKEVLAVCPPYEKEALVKFLETIKAFRNNGYRNLSLILPDYRNKSEIAEIKKMLSISGLRRSSSFEILANISRTINVFRIGELEKSLVDGVYLDLFRLKMNMLGVEKLTASTHYAEGMKSLVEYLHESIPSDTKSIVNITGFANSEKVLGHVLDFGFWAIGASLEDADRIKKEILAIENKHIANALGSKRKGRVKRKS